MGYHGTNAHHRGRLSLAYPPLKKAAVLGILMSALLFAAGAGAVPAQAGVKTRVITTKSEDDFAKESAKLTKKYSGTGVQGSGIPAEYSSARLIVRLKDGKKMDFSRYSATTVVESTFGVNLVQFSSASDARKAAQSIAKSTSVKYVEGDDHTLDVGDVEIRQIFTSDGTPEDGESASGTTMDGIEAAESFDKSQKKDVIYDSTIQAGKGVSASATAMSWGVSYIQADKYAAYAKANTSRSIKVAVIDSGVTAHTKLSGRLLTGIDLVDNDTDASDRNGHGTHVAGTVVDCTPGLKVYLLPVRVMDSSGNGSPSVVGNGIRYAVNKGAKVLNLSLGGYSHYNYLEECINYAKSKGVTVVVAAGNEDYDTTYICPAHMETPIVVGSINENGVRSTYSNHGASIDVVAPGENIVSCWMGGGYAIASGTSMAAPHVSAVAAMFRLMYPTYGAADTQKIIRSFAKDLGPKGTDYYYGRGVPKMAGAIKPSSVALSKKTTSLQVKKTLTLKATIKPSYAGQKKLTWSSSNSSVVAVSSSGKLTAKKKGTATITVKTVNGKKATCKVTVTGVKAQSVSLNTTAKSMKAGTSAKLTATVSPSNTENKKITWTSSAPSVASVSGGKVTAIKKGTATITAATSNGKKKTCRITVVENPAKVSASAKSITPIKQQTAAAGTAAPSTAAPKTTEKLTTSAQTLSPHASEEPTLPEELSFPEELTTSEQAAAAQTFEEPTLPEELSFTEELTTSEQAAAAQASEELTPPEELTTSEQAAAAQTFEELTPPEELPAFEQAAAAQLPEDQPAFEQAAASQMPEDQPTFEQAAAEQLPEDLPASEQAAAAQLPEDLPASEQAAAAQMSEDLSASGQDVFEDNDSLNASSEVFPRVPFTPSITPVSETFTVGPDENTLQIHVDAVLPTEQDLTAGQDLSAEQIFPENQDLSADADDPAGQDLSAGPNDHADPDSPFVLTLLREEADGTLSLLGAVNLSGENNAAQTMFREEPSFGTEQILFAEETGGDSAQTTFLGAEDILFLTGMNKDGDNYSIDLLADISAAAGTASFADTSAAGGTAPTQTIWNCRLAVYDTQTFENRTAAASASDSEGVRTIDEQPLCSCGITVTIESPSAPAPQEDPAETAAEEIPPAEAAPEYDPATDTPSDNAALELDPVTDTPSENNTPEYEPAQDESFENAALELDPATDTPSENNTPEYEPAPDEPSENNTSEDIPAQDTSPEDLIPEYDSAQELSITE